MFVEKFCIEIGDFCIGNGEKLNFCERKYGVQEKKIKVKLSRITIQIHTSISFTSVVSHYKDRHEEAPSAKRNDSTHQCLLFFTKLMILLVFII